jgi:hypothetical protein
MMMTMSAKQPFLSHGIPWKILPDLSSSFYFSGVCNNIFFSQSKVVSLASNPQPGGRLTFTST